MALKGQPLLPSCAAISLSQPRQPYSSISGRADFSTFGSAAYIVIQSSGGQRIRVELRILNLSLIIFNKLFKNSEFEHGAVKFELGDVKFNELVVCFATLDKRNARMIAHSLDLVKA